MTTKFTVNQTGVFGDKPVYEVHAHLGTTTLANAEAVANKANAAPELLAALRDIADALDRQANTVGAPLYGDLGTHNFVHRARAVITKAEGRA